MCIDTNYNYISVYSLLFVPCAFRACSEAPYVLRDTLYSVIIVNPLLSQSVIFGVRDAWQLH